MAIESLVNRFELNTRAAGMSPQTVAHVKRVIGFFKIFMGDISDVRQVTADDLKRFIIALQERRRWQGLPQDKGKSLSGTTINTYVRAIKSFWSWLAKEKIIEENPFADVPAPKLPKKLPKILSEDDLTRILKTSQYDDREHAIIELLLDSGIRLGELVNLNVNDVDTQTGVVKVFGKGSKEGRVFISDSTRAAVGLYWMDSRPKPRGEDKLFLTYDGYPLTKGRVQKILERIGKKAGITTRLSPHKLRHSYATLSLKYGANLEYVRRTLRHTDIKTTEVYLSVSDADIENAHRQFSPVENITSKTRKR
jgi:integrase/recombinase XerD